MLRFESIITTGHLKIFLSYLPVILVIRLFFYLKDGLYKGLWRYASIGDLVKIIKSAAMGSVVFLVAVRYLMRNTDYPRSVYVLDLLLFIIMAGGSRLFIRIFKEYMGGEIRTKRVLLVGAGDAGEMLVRDMRSNPRFGYDPVGFIDDDQYKKGLTIHGVPILGPTSQIPRAIMQYNPDEILICLPSEDSRSIKEVYEYCKPYSVHINKLPRMSDILDGNISVATRLGQFLMDAGLLSAPQVKEALVLQRREGGRFGEKLIKLGYIKEDELVMLLQKQNSVSGIRPVSLEDLLQREPVREDVLAIREYIEGKSVLVTGAGGSIGSELCRQIIKYDPSRLIMLDRYENGLFHIDMELKALKYPNVSTIVGDIRDEPHTDFIYSVHRPRIIFHAAAYKHVPLMEENPVEAIKNNIFGTRNLIRLSDRYGAESFVMISTDKAVNPASVMGATKRVAEYLTINMSGMSKTKFTVVRFGNVLGTNGSVIPIFKEQLKRGGPITVTHPEMKRYFMLVPEAMQLVLIAAASGTGGEVLVLDMGEPVRIVDLAENLIRLSGFMPHKEIKIEFTGLRPGEKLYEDLFDASEHVMPTPHSKLKRAVSSIPPREVLEAHLMELEATLNSLSGRDILKYMDMFLPGFTQRNGNGLFAGDGHAVGK
jgi:FlaA1/EpsC-like NDP-sugar epimerase